MGFSPAARRWLGVWLLVIVPLSASWAQDTALSGRAKGLDANNNGVVDRSEARGRLAGSFDEIDCDRSGALDGAEIRGFFRGTGCPNKQATAKSGASGSKALSGPAKNMDANGNGVIDRDEARGPLAANFASADTDKSGALDGMEIRRFFAARSGGRTASGPSAGQVGGERPPARVVVEEIVVQPLSQTFPVIGRLVARQSGAISSQIAGALAELRVNVGDRLEKGDIIAVISKDRLLSQRDRYAAAVGRYKGMVAAAQAEYDKKVHELRRIDRLRQSSAFSRARYEDLERDVQARKGTLEERQAQLREAQAELDRANIDLRDAEIKAPFPGVVSEKHTDVGTYLGVGNRVVTVINDRDIEVEAEVPTDRIGGIRIGTQVVARLDDGSVHKAVVRAIVPQENLRTRTRPVRFTPHFNGIGKALAENQSVTINIPLSAGRTVTTVHKDAVVRDAQQSFVYVVANGFAQRRDVRLGDAVGARLVVLAGLKPGEKVVVRGNESLGRGRSVDIVGATGG